MKKVLAWGDVAFFVALAVFVIVRTQWNLRAWVGLGLIAGGFPLWITARLQLGRSFSAAARARVLVTSGLYARFRHPIYLFGFFAYLGVFLMWGKWIFLGLFLLLYPIEVIRLRTEERVLEEAFGDQYRRYKARTWL